MGSPDAVPKMNSVGIFLCIFLICDTMGSKGEDIE